MAARFNPSNSATSLQPTLAAVDQVPAAHCTVKAASKVVTGNRQAAIRNRKAAAFSPTNRRH